MVHKMTGKKETQKKMCWSNNSRESTCKKICAPGSIFCYRHCNIYHIETEWGIFQHIFHSLKRTLLRPTNTETMQKCLYNENDFNCGICFEKYDKNRLLVFLQCCSNKQVACVDCISNIMIEYHKRRHRQELADNDYLFFLISRTSFPCPYCRTFVFPAQIDKCVMIAHIRKNVLQKIVNK